MSKYLLDTNILSELMRSVPYKAVLEWFESNTDSDFFISAVTEAEILTGIALLQEGRKRSDLTNAASQDFSGRILSFDENSAVIYAQIAVNRVSTGHPISTEDAQIASIALSNDLILVTRNVKDFTGIKGLVIINPWDEIPQKFSESN